MNSQERYSEIPDWKLERYLLGELDPGEMDRIRQEIDKNDALGIRLEALRQSDKEILERYPVSRMGRQINRKLKGAEASSTRINTGFRSKFWPMPVVPALAIILLIAILPALFPPNVNETGKVGIDQTIRLKGGGARLVLFRKTESGSERLENGALAREHDLILMQYHAATRAYGVIISIDGNRTINQHMPEEGGLVAPLNQEGAVSLEFAYELDDAPGWEQFYFITSDVPFELETIIQAARYETDNLTDSKPGSLDLPDKFEQFLFTLKKEETDD
jgi:hypothetical protein